jgi:hypothetical protein
MIPERKSESTRGRALSGLKFDVPPALCTTAGVDSTTTK